MFSCLFYLQQDPSDGLVFDVDEKLFEIKTTTNSTSANNHVTSSPCAKRKRVEPSSLSEQEQIALAIGRAR